MGSVIRFYRIKNTFKLIFSKYIRAEKIPMAVPGELLWRGRLILDRDEEEIEKKVYKLFVNIGFLDKSKNNDTTFNWGQEITEVHMKRFLKSSLKWKNKEGKKINLNKYLKNSQVVSVSNEQEESLNLVSLLQREGEEKYIGYLKPDRDDLTTIVIVGTEVNTQPQVIGFCVDDPYGDEEDRLNSSRIFHSLLIGREDSTALQTSQENSIITEDIEEDFQIFKKELSDQSDERGNNSAIMEHQFTEATQKVNQKNDIQSAHEDIKYPCTQCDYQATQTGDLKKH